MVALATHPSSRIPAAHSRLPCIRSQRCRPPGSFLLEPLPCGTALWDSGFGEVRTSPAWPHSQTHREFHPNLDSVLELGVQGVKMGGFFFFL